MRYISARVYDNFSYSPNILEDHMNYKLLIMSDELRAFNSPGYGQIFS